MTESPLLGFDRDVEDGRRSSPYWPPIRLSPQLHSRFTLFAMPVFQQQQQTTIIACKDFVRQDALQMLENALEGSGATGAPAAYSEAFRIIMRSGVTPL